MHAVHTLDIMRKHGRTLIFQRSVFFTYKEVAFKDFKNRLLSYYKTAVDELYDPDDPSRSVYAHNV